MKKTHRLSLGGVGACMLAIGVFSNAALGAIEAITARIESTVQEYVGGEAQSNDNSFETFPETSPTLPMETLAALGSFVTDDVVGYGGQGIAEFIDPTLSPDPNPRELGVEASAVSLDPSTHYVVDSLATEHRDVVFSTEELGFSITPERLVVSTAFLNGAILVWTAESSRDLTGLEAGFDIDIVQVSETGTNGEEIVFTASITIEGQADGEVDATQSTILDSILGGPELLQVVNDDGSLDDLIASLGDAGRLHLLILPQQSIDYVYTAEVDVPFELVAELRCRTTNLPDGTIVAAALGRDFASLADALTPVLNADMALRTQSAVNRAIATLETDNDSDAPSAPMCGALGLESLAGLLMFATLVGTRNGSNRRRLMDAHRRKE